MGVGLEIIEDSFLDFLDWGHLSFYIDLFFKEMVVVLLYGHLLLYYLQFNLWFLS